MNRKQRLISSIATWFVASIATAFWLGRPTPAMPGDDCSGLEQCPDELERPVQLFDALSIHTLHPSQIGKPCRYDDETAEFFDRSEGEFLCAECSEKLFYASQELRQIEEFSADWPYMEGW